MAQTETATATTQTAGKKEGKPYNMKLKPEQAGGKFKGVGTMFLRNDDTGGVATLFKDDGTKIENVSIFTDEAKSTDAGKAFVMKLKPKQAGGKWEIVGTILMKADRSEGVATLIKDNGDKLENVKIFLNDRKYAGPKKN